MTSWRGDSNGSAQREHLGRSPPAPRRDYLQVVRHDGAAAGPGEPTPGDGVHESDRAGAGLHASRLSSCFLLQVFSTGPASLLPVPPAPAADPLRFSCRNDPGDDATARARSTHPSLQSLCSSRIQTEVGPAQAGGATQPHLVSIDSSWIAYS